MGCPLFGRWFQISTLPLHLAMWFLNLPLFPSTLLLNLATYIVEFLTKFIIVGPIQSNPKKRRSKLYPYPPKVLFRFGSGQSNFKQANLWLNPWTSQFESKFELHLYINGGLSRIYIGPGMGDTLPVPSPTPDEYPKNLPGLTPVPSQIGGYSTQTGRGPADFFFANPNIYYLRFSQWNVIKIYWNCNFIKLNFYFYHYFYIKLLIL